MSSKVSTELSRRLLATSKETQESVLESTIDILLASGCESPIEALMGAATLLYDQLFMGGPRLEICSAADFQNQERGKRLLISQMPVGNYRIDWVLVERGGFIFIECDGHDFHERTKEQAARDRSKDRDIQRNGVPILRFTGSEIYRDPMYCAEQALSFLDERGQVRA